MHVHKSKEDIRMKNVWLWIIDESCYLWNYLKKLAGF